MIGSFRKIYFGKGLGFILTSNHKADHWACSIGPCDQRWWRYIGVAIFICLSVCCLGVCLIDLPHVISLCSTMDDLETGHEDAKQLLRTWLNKSMKVEMTDGRTLIGTFLCTDRDRNLILGSCEEYLKPPDMSEKKEEPRILGLAMIPGHHIVSVHIDNDKHLGNCVM